MDIAVGPWLMPTLLGLVIGFFIGKLTGRRDDTRIIYSETDLRRADADVQALAMQGKMIQAIKRHRELSGLGLKESKEYVEALRDHLAANPPR